MFLNYWFINNNIGSATIDLLKLIYSPRFDNVASKDLWSKASLKNTNGGLYF